MSNKNMLIMAVLIAAGMFAISTEALHAETARRDYCLRSEGGLVMDGQVRSVSFSGLSDPNTRLILRSNDGTENEIIVKPNAAIYRSSEGRLLSVSELRFDDRVCVTYTQRSDGTMRAAAIKIDG